MPRSNARLRRERRPAMGKASRDKGARRERELVARHVKAGIHAERVPLSGAAGGSYSGDLTVTPANWGAPLRCELKARKTGAGFIQIETWLAGNDVLFLHRDRAAPLAVVPWEVWLDLIGGRREGDE